MEVNIIINLHPSDRLKYPERFDELNIYKSDSKDFYSLLKLSACVVSSRSTIGLETASASAPILIDESETPQLDFNYYQDNLRVGVRINLSNDCTIIKSIVNEYRDFVYWNNPYDDVLTNQIWPDQETSNQAQNTTTKTLNLSTTSNWEQDSWNGISTALYPSDYNQERSKYIDVWIYTDAIQDQNMKLNIDIGHISEDMNNDNILNSEDQAIFGNIGNNILDEGEDVGFDGCLDEYEDVNGSSL